MPYRIHYTPQYAHKYPSVRRTVKNKLGKWGACLVLTLLLAWLGLRVVPEFLVPGNPDVTKTATLQLIAHIREGMTVDEAIIGFCKQVIDAAET